MIMREDRTFVLS